MIPPFWNSIHSNYTSVQMRPLFSTDVTAKPTARWSIKPLVVTSLKVYKSAKHFMLYYYTLYLTRPCWNTLLCPLWHHLKSRHYFFMKKPLGEERNSFLTRITQCICFTFQGQITKPCESAAFISQYFKLWEIKMSKNRFAIQKVCLFISSFSS